MNKILIRFSIGMLIGILLFGLPVTGTLYAQSSASPVLSSYEQGRSFMLQEDWYAAAEYFLEALHTNPNHIESIAALAECYYELREYDQAFTWIRKARLLSRADTSLANLEALILIALGRIEAAESILKDILANEPYNRDALFAAAELEVARGRAGEAVQRYREAVRRYPDDSRALLSLALVLGSLGDVSGAESFVKRAVEENSGDYRVHYYSAYLDADAGRLDAAGRSLSRVLVLKPDFLPARSLLASVTYRSGNYLEAAAQADQVISKDRNAISAWFLKGLSFARLGRPSDARLILSQALSINPDDEFVRTALEDLILKHTALEDSERIPWARYHFERARDFKTRNLSDQALFEYRRGLRINPYADERREYAELLRVSGFPYRHLEELRFIQDRAQADQAVNDAVEAYDSLLSDSLHRRWKVDPINMPQSAWKLAVFSVGEQSSSLHVDASSIASSYLKDILIHDAALSLIPVELRQNSFSSAFRSAREAGADYFMIISASENERDLSLKAELFVARTGTAAASYVSFRTGPDRLRNAARQLGSWLSDSLPFRAALIDRHSSQALINKGKADGVSIGDTYEIVRQGAVQVDNEGIGFSYNQNAVVGSLIIEELDELVAAGTLTRSGFFDRISKGDEIIEKSEEESPVVESQDAVDPELQSMLRTLR